MTEKSEKSDYIIAVSKNNQLITHFSSLKLQSFVHYPKAHGHKWMYKISLFLLQWCGKMCFTKQHVHLPFHFSVTQEQNPKILALLTGHLELQTRPIIYFSDHFLIQGGSIYEVKFLEPRKEIQKSLTSSKCKVNRKSGKSWVGETLLHILNGLYN